MRPVLLLAIPLLAFAVQDTAQARPRHPQTISKRSTMKRPATARQKPEAKKCHDAGSTRWFGADTQLPLATYDGHALASADTLCCAAWGRAGTTWRALDAFGQLVGTAQMDIETVTQCDDLEMTPQGGRARHDAVMFASDSGPWQPPASAQWAAPQEAKASFDRFVTIAEQRAFEGAPSEQARTQRRSTHALFFKVVDGNTTMELAVGGGRALVIAQRGANGEWTASHVEYASAQEDVTYRPEAVFDMDGDGVPEVIFRREANGIMLERVLKTSRPIQRWDVAALGVVPSP